MLRTDDALEHDAPPRPLRDSLTLAGICLAAPLIAYLWFRHYSLASTTTWDDGQYAIPAWELGAGGNGALSQFPRSFSPNEIVRFKALYGRLFENGVFIAPRHLWWSSIESIASALGLWGLRVPPILGVVASVLGAHRLSKVLGHRASAPLAGLLVVLSPMMYLGLHLWAHTAVAAAFTAALIGAVHILNGERTSSSLGLLVLGCVVASFLRGDGLVFALALGLGMGWVAISRSLRFKTVDTGLLACAALAFLASGAAFAASSLLGSEVAGPTSVAPPALTGSKTAGSQVMAAVASLFSTPKLDHTGFAFLVVGVVLTVAAVLALRKGQTWGNALLLLAGAAFLARLLTDPTEPANGLLAAWPVCLLIFTRPWRRLGDAEGMICVALALGTAGVLVSQYSIQLGHWGGRYLAAALPAACVLVGASTSTRVSEGAAAVPALRSRVALFAICASLLPSLFYDAQMRNHSEWHLAFLEATEARGVFVTSFDHIAMRDWAAYPERQWLKVPSEGGIESVVTFLSQKHIYEFVAYSVEADEAEWLLGQPPPSRYVDGNGVFFRPIKVSTADGIDERTATVVGIDG